MANEGRDPVSPLLAVHRLRRAFRKCKRIERIQRTGPSSFLRTASGRITTARPQNENLRSSNIIRYYSGLRVRAGTSEGEDRETILARLDDPSRVPSNVIQPLFHSHIC